MNSAGCTSAVRTYHRLDPPPETCQHTDVRNSPEPKYLYKYTPFSSNSLGPLCRTEVFYSDPEKFNDPFDSKLFIHNDVGDEFYTKLWIQVLSKITTRVEIQNIHAKAAYESSEYGSWKSNETAKTVYESCVLDAIKGIFFQKMKRKGVLSLAEKWNCPLMWSHYGDQHKGICMEYRLQGRQKKIAIDKVNYDSSRKVCLSEICKFLLSDSDDSRNKLIQMIYYNKAKEWRYEKEWRVLYQQPGVAGSAPFLLNAIHFGIRADHAVLKSLIKLFSHSEDQGIKMYDVYESGKGFSLKRRLIDKSEILSAPAPRPMFEFFENLPDITDEVDDPECTEE